ncbi:MAG: sigma-54 dependent transcriptional regulator [Novosphingobium sp.]|nr:sigma-54 dependent transcriptional regulator [Novosphingobium sp.]
MNVLLVEDDASIAIVITAALQAEGIAVSHCTSIAERDARLAERRFQALITDVMLPDGDGIETLEHVRASHPDMPIIILSAQNTLDTAVRASGTGAFEYFPKPFDLDELVRAVRQSFGSSQPASEAPDEATGQGKLPLVGRSQTMQAVFRMITRVLRNDLTVLILGESGTGKELTARALHANSHRSSGPLVAVNCGAIPESLLESEFFGVRKGAYTGATHDREGYFQAARGGTLFLDEIGDMPMQAQTRLLRALQSGKIRRVGGQQEIELDVRIIAATNRDLQPMIAEGSFREDLFYRLNVVPIRIPPLRERREDIDALARHFLQLAAQEGLPRRKLTPEALDRLSRLPWRGNVRELKNFIFRLALLAREDVIDVSGLEYFLDQERLERPEALPGPSDLDSAVEAWLAATRPAPGTIYAQALAAFERPLFAQILRETGGNQLRAAQRLGINRNTLRKRLNDLRITADERASGARQ